MNWITKLFKSKKIRIQDKDFGDLLLVESSQPINNYWEGRGLFIPDNIQIEYFIKTISNTPPSEIQRSFLNEIYSKTTNLKKVWKKALDKEMRKWGNYRGLDPFDKYLNISSIEIPKLITLETKWDITFDSKIELYSEHTYRITMRGWNIESVIIDG